MGITKIEIKCNVDFKNLDRKKEEVMKLIKELKQERTNDVTLVEITIK